jgi:hypothetical protein
MAFLGCDHVQGLLGMGGEEGGNNEVPDVPNLPVARTYYVAASENHWSGDGTSEHPTKTVEEALGKLGADYAQGDWPGKGEANEEAGKIIIRGEVTASSPIRIAETGYPSIVLCGEPGGKSKLTWNGATATDCFLKIMTGAKVTLEEDLTLTLRADSRAVVYVYGEFTMNGGTIAGNSASYGGGVYFRSNNGRVLKTDGGIIYGVNEGTNANTAANQGHRVYIYIPYSGSFRKRDATADEGIPLDSDKTGTADGWD